MHSPSASSVFASLRLGGVFYALASVATAHVQLDTPNGGEFITAGQTYRVEWHITVPHGQENWDLAYSTTGSMGPWIDVAVDLPPGSTAGGSNHFYDWIVPDTPSSLVYVRITMDNPTGTPDYDDRSNGSSTIVACSPPSNYCSTSPNSVGAGALIGWSGTPNVSTNAFVLTATNAPANKPGLFFYGAGQSSTPFGDGLRCVGAGGEGIFRLGPPVVTNGSGQVSRFVDVTLPPANADPGGLDPGDTYNFQFWYRDPTGGPNGFNLSDGLSVTFCP